MGALADRWRSLPDLPGFLELRKGRRVTLRLSLPPQEGTGEQGDCSQEQYAGGRQR